MLRDFLLKLVTPFTILIEAYRVFNGTLLVIFVPGVCDGRACLPQQNFENGNLLYRVTCGVNAATLLAFIALYLVEVRREYKLAVYLRINHDLPSNALTVKGAFDKLTIEQKKRLHVYDRLYQHVVRVTVCMFIVNTILSGYVIIKDYGNDKGPTLFATGTILIISKIYNIISIGNFDGYVSAYKHERVQFNDVQHTEVEPAV
jgi:hypothetical protein